MNDIDRTASAAPATQTAQTARTALSCLDLTSLNDADTEADIAAIHGTIRAALSARFGEAGARTRILYGGSMKPSNAKAILALPNVDGGLVGGASLVAADFLAIAKAAG